MRYRTAILLMAGLEAAAIGLKAVAAAAVEVVRLLLLLTLGQATIFSPGLSISGRAVRLYSERWMAHRKPRRGSG